MARTAVLTGAGMSAGGSVSLVRRVLRDNRLIVPLCIILICSSFAAAALIQMRLDRARVLAQAAAAGRTHVTEVATIAAGTLDRYARLGVVYADSLHPAVARAEPGVRDIILLDAGHQVVAALNGTDNAKPLPRTAFSGKQVLFPGGMAFADHGRSIAVLFDPATLVPPALLNGAGLVTGKAHENIRAAVPGWPLTAVTRVDEDSALSAWGQLLPLYLFVILGPAIAGGWLAALFVGAFERHAKAARSLKALRSTRPEEAQLLVRLAQAEREASEGLRAKSEFIAHMSHELRTPLNAVIGFSEVIAEGYFGPTGNPKYAEYARDIHRAGHDLHAKVTDILEFANIEAGRYPLRVELVDLTALAAQVIEQHQGRAFSRRIALALHFAEPGTVRADSMAVRRILTNLLANALDYTAEDGWVRLDVRFEADAGVLTVRDSGSGFSAAEQSKAGRAFERFDRDGKITGAGLGLAIAMELARRMGGVLRLASPPGQGAVMEVRLPKP